MEFYQDNGNLPSSFPFWLKQGQLLERRDVESTSHKEKLKYMDLRRGRKVGRGKAFVKSARHTHFHPS